MFFFFFVFRRKIKFQSKLSSATVFFFVRKTVFSDSLLPKKFSPAASWLYKWLVSVIISFHSLCNIKTCLDDYLFTKKFCFTNLKLGSLTALSLRWTQQLLSAEHTFRNKDISIFEKTVFNGSIFGIHTNLTEMYSTTSFWIWLKLWVRDENYCHWGKFGEDFFSQGLIGVSYREIVSKTFLVIFIYKNNCH